MKHIALWLACLCSLTMSEGKWAYQSYAKHLRDKESMKSNYRQDVPTPPDHNDYIRMARYIIHYADWASMATISVLPAIEGYPFSSVESMVDGTWENSTGIPYFYMTIYDFSSNDLLKDNRATILVSLKETSYCEKQNLDAIDPRCARVMISGFVRKMEEGTPEYKFAKIALFERHPAMAHYPSDHDWFVAKLKINQILLFDYFGGAKNIPVRDYLAYNYVESEMTQFQRPIQLDTIMAP